MPKILLATFLLQFFLVSLPKASLAETWAIYWYLCGSDLEEQYGAATNDIVEVANATFSKDVQVVMQTGGTKNWEAINSGSRPIKISPKSLQRYVIGKNTFKKVADLPQGNMGSPKTLASFLKFCLEKYPADHKVLIIWDHGGGSSKDFANDQNYGMKGMTLAQLHQALSEVFGPKPAKPPFDIIGFDACLMATIDTAIHTNDFAKYLIASEEIESGFGWEYTTPLTKLSQNTTMTPVEFGRSICDSFLKANQEAKDANFDPSNRATLSVIDLAKARELKTAWDMVGFEALSAYVDDNKTVSVLGRKAYRSEKFANSKSEGYSNMMDMGCFLQNIRQLYPDTVDLALKTLQETVLYKVSGRQHKKAMGISCYYPFDQAETFKTMLSEHNLSAFVILQGLQFGKLNGDLAERYYKKVYANVDAFINAKPTYVAQTELPKPIASQQPSGSVGSVAGIVATPQQRDEKPRPAPSQQPSGSIGSVASIVATPQQRDEKPRSAASQQPSGSIGSVASIVATPQQRDEKPRPAAGQQPSIGAVASIVARPREGERDFQAFSYILSGVSTISNYKPMEKFDITSLEDWPLTITKDSVQLKLGKEKSAYIDNIIFYLGILDKKNNFFLILGNDADIYSDWDKGVFSSHFQNHWVELNDNPVCLDVIAQDENAFYYAIPAKLNDVLVNIYATYDRKSSSYSISGARKIMSNGLPEKFLIKIKPGDKITTIFYGKKIGGDLQEIELDTFIIKDKLVMKNEYLGDCSLLYAFEMYDVQGQSALSKLALIDIVNGKINIREYN